MKKTTKRVISKTEKMDNLLKELDEIYYTSSRWQDSVGGKKLSKEYDDIYNAIFTKYCLYTYIYDTPTAYTFMTYSFMSVHTFIFKDYAQNAFDSHLKTAQDQSKDGLIEKGHYIKYILERVTFDEMSHEERSTILENKIVDWEGNIHDNL